MISKEEMLQVESSMIGRPVTYINMTVMVFHTPDGQEHALTATSPGSSATFPTASTARTRTSKSG